ncbi:MAG: class I SAM-dependent methyltransferase [Proteobacteria bacterium]|nr:class I SAM-dependent methyltransferase [Pseudomonadota bacterium]
MARMTDALHTSSGPVSHFYDALAEDYDAMTGFADRFARERSAFQLLVERFGVRTAADAGTGTGFHALLLAELGVDVTAIDVSRAMAERLRLHAAERELRIRVEVGDIRQLHKHTASGLDAIFCMGNTLAHMKDTRELEEALRSFALALRPGGLVVIQLLNYDRILERRETIQNIRQVGGKTFVRFYVFEEDCIQFNVLQIWTEAGALRHQLETVRLNPIGRSELCAGLEQAGLVEIQSYGSIALEEYLGLASKDLVVVARMPA